MGNIKLNKRTDPKKKLKTARKPRLGTQDLEDKILKLLKDSTGNILDDEQLINTLNHSKLTSSVIAVR